VQAYVQAYASLAYFTEHTSWLQSDCNMKKLNKTSVIELSLTVHVMYSLTVYADSMLHCLLCFNEVDVKTLTS